MTLTSTISWKPAASLAALRLRAQVNAAIRAHFATTGALEVETPILSASANTEPNIQSFHTRFCGPVHGGKAERYLRTSPEFALKRLLAAGVGDCYELGRVFRDGEAGGRHNPEFTMLEWYRVGWTLAPLIDETVALVQAALALIGREATVTRLSFRDLYAQRLGFDPMTAELDVVRNAAAGIAIDGEGLTRDDWLDLLMTHVLQPGFGRDEILVVHDYPATQSALARVVERDGVPVAERFELYLGALELANGYHELTDAVEQRVRFERDVVVRQARGDIAPPIDAALLDALAHGMPACSGVALGVDRLLMAMRDTPRIADVLAFDFGRA